MAAKKWYQFIIDFINSILKPKPPVIPSYIVEVNKRDERIAKSVSFDMIPARDGTQSLEDVPVWAYAGTNPDDWNGGNTRGPLSVRVKANDTNSSELKVGLDAYVKEPDVQAPCQTGVKVSMLLELTSLGVTLTANGKSATVPCKLDMSKSYTIGIGWPPQKRQRCLGAKLDNVKFA